MRDLLLAACRRLRAFSPRVAARVARAVEVTDDLRLHAFEALIGQEKPDGFEADSAFMHAYECGAGAERWDAFRFLRAQGLGIEADALLAGDHLRAEAGGTKGSEATERRVDILLALGDVVPLGMSLSELEAIFGEATLRDVDALAGAGLIVARGAILHVSDDAQSYAHSEGLRVFVGRRFVVPRTPADQEASTLPDVEERAAVGSVLRAHAAEGMV